MDRVTHCDVTRCLGCGANIPEVDGPIHAYMLAAPGCWEQYCSLQDWLMRLGGEDAIATVQDLVDCFAAQHATNPDRRNRQSVAVHLVSLCARFEHGLPGRKRRRLIGTWSGREYPELLPRPVGYPVTAADAAAAPETEQPSLIEHMAASTWEAWATHHGTVRSWLDGSRRGVA